MNKYQQASYYYKNLENKINISKSHGINGCIKRNEMAVQSGCETAIS
jgi:hypothetical protein